MRKEQGTGDFIVYFHENRGYSLVNMAGAYEILIRMLSLDFLKVLHKFLKH